MGRMSEVNNELHRFADAFQSEEDLRKHIATLLNKIPHNQGVQITHGSQEYGKDIIFYAPDGFGNWRLNACVVKRTKISGSVDDNLGARTVFSQAEQAFDTPFVNGTGEEERVSKVFIISPFDCSQTTIHSIEGKLKMHFGKIEFLCGGNLFDKFSKYWPEFVIFESTLLGSYVASLQQSFEQSDPISFLATQNTFFSNAGKSLRNVYVRQGFHVSLQQIDFLVEQPSFHILEQAVRLSDIDMLCEQLEFVCNWVRHRQVWEVPDAATVSQFENGLNELSEQLREAWHRLERERQQAEELKRERLSKERVQREQAERDQLAHERLQHEKLKSGQVQPWDHRKEQLDRERLERERLDAERRQQEKQATTVELSEFMKLTNTPLISQLTEILNAFKKRVHAANEFVRNAVKRPFDLHSPEYLNYLRVREVVRLYPAGFRKASKTHYKQFPETLLDMISGAVLVTAPAGFGKTSFCKWNTLHDVQGLIERTSSVIPVYVPLHQLATIGISSCEEVFFRSAEVVQLVKTAQLNNQKIRIYLDGLDEVTTVEQQERLMNLAATLRNRYPSIQVVVTGRNYVTGPWLRWLTRLHLSEFNDKQVEELISNWLAADLGECDDFKKQLGKSRPLQPLMRIPLLGTLTIAVFKKMKSLPETKVRLYELFVALMCGGWDLAKNIRRETRFGSQAKLGTLTRLAGLLHAGQKREALEADVRTAISQTMTGYLEQWRSMLDELLEDGLLVRVGGNSVAFSHLSFQEYLAATELTDPNGSRQQQILKRYLAGDDWWREVLGFYVGMSRRPDETEVWLRRTVTDIQGSNRPYDLTQRFDFLIESLASTWPAWIPNKKHPVLIHPHKG